MQSWLRKPEEGKTGELEETDQIKRESKEISNGKQLDRQNQSPPKIHSNLH